MKTARRDAGRAAAEASRAPRTYRLNGGQMALILLPTIGVLIEGQQPELLFTHLTFLF